MRLLRIARETIAVAIASTALACNACAPAERPAPTTASPPEPPPRTPREAIVETPKKLETATAYRARLRPYAVLYIPPWFSAKHGTYDLMFHFHGVGRWQESNLEKSQLNVAVVSINLGVGTDPYSATFSRPDVFAKLLADTEAEIERSGQAAGAHRRRLAFSAWSAGFVSIAKIMSDASQAERVDAVLLADGFFTSFSNQKKRTVNAAGLEKFAKFAAAATRDEKLFGITHTTIPTGPYPSVQECVTKLLDMMNVQKVPAVALGPREMKQFYVVDQGSFHVKGYQGETAPDHVRQLQTMGETLYPYLKTRWEAQDAKDAKDANDAHDAGRESRAPLAPKAVDPPQPRAGP